MTIVYLYTALCTVGGADRSIIQKANGSQMPAVKVAAMAS